MEACNRIPGIANKNQIVLIFLKLAYILVQAKKNGEQTLNEVLIRGLAVQIYSVLSDLQEGHSFSKTEEGIRARENIKLLLLRNLPKHLVIVGLVGRIPVPGTTEMIRFTIYNNRFLYRFGSMKFQDRGEDASNLAIQQLRSYVQRIIEAISRLA